MAGWRESGEGEAELSDINVTPFIDVMLVLLVIFMVAAPLSTVEVPVELPAAAGPAQGLPAEPILLTLGADLSLQLGAAGVGRADLAQALRRQSGGDTEQRIFLRADRGVDYGAVMEVMGLLREAGYLKVALVGLEAAP